MPYSSNPSIPISHNFDSSDSSDNDRTDGSPEEIQSTSNNLKFYKKRKQCVESSRRRNSNPESSKIEIARIFLNQQRERNEILERFVKSSENMPKYIGALEVMDRLNCVLDTKQPSYETDYFDMLTIFKNEWLRECFMNLPDDMLSGFMDHFLRHHRAGQLRLPNQDGSCCHYPSPNMSIMPLITPANSNSNPHAPPF